MYPWVFFSSKRRIIKVKIKDTVNKDNTLPIPTNAKQDVVEKKPNDAIHIAFIEIPPLFFKSFIRVSVYPDDNSDTIEQRLYIQLKPKQ